MLLRPSLGPRLFFPAAASAGPQGRKGEGNGGRYIAAAVGAGAAEAAVAVVAAAGQRQNDDEGTDDGDSMLAPTKELKCSFFDRSLRSVR